MIREGEERLDNDSVWGHTTIYCGYSTKCWFCTDISLKTDDQ